MWEQTCRERCSCGPSSGSERLPGPPPSVGSGLSLLFTRNVPSRIHLTHTRDFNSSAAFTGPQAHCQYLQQDSPSPRPASAPLCFLWFPWPLSLWTRTPQYVVNFSPFHSHGCSCCNNSKDGSPGSSPSPFLIYCLRPSHSLRPLPCLTASCPGFTQLQIGRGMTLCALASASPSLHKQEAHATSSLALLQTNLPCPLQDLVQ